MTTMQWPTRGRIVGNLSCQNNSYLRSLDARVLSCTPYIPNNSSKELLKLKSKKSTVLPNGDGVSIISPEWLIEFDDSVLFPEGGGQPTDHGTLTVLSDKLQESIKVENIQRQGLRCIVHSPKPLEAGQSVRQDVDFERRWDLMQQHTGQHLLTAIMNKYDNLQTLGWGMGSEGEMSYVDLPRKPSEEETQEIQKKVNDAIQQNIKVTVETPTDASSTKLPEDYDTTQGVVRVVKIGDLDNNACCGTHLQQTAHIAVLLLGPNTPASGGRNRQFFIAGNRAIQHATTATQTIRTLNQILSSGPNPTDLINNITKQQETMARLKKHEAKLMAEIAVYEADRTRIVLRDGRDVFIHRPEPGMDFVNAAATLLKDDVGESNVLVLASGEGEKGGAVLIIGRKESVEAFVVKVKQAFPSIKGGGKGERWQGKMMEWKTGDLEKLQELLGV